MTFTLSAGARAFARRAAKGGIAALAIALGAPLLSEVFETAEAKTPGSKYCFYGTCHRVKSLTEMQSLVGSDVTLSASFYDSCARDAYNPCGLTSSGERFHPDRADNAASPIYPDGTMLLAWSPVSKAAAVLRINNAGPYWGDRKLDVSRAAAEKLGFKPYGVGKLQVRIVNAPDRAEATYSAGRSYEPVLGYIGEYPSLDAAEAGMTALVGLDTLKTALLAPATGAFVTSSTLQLKRNAMTVLARGPMVAPDGEGAVQIAQAAPAFTIPAEVARLMTSLESQTPPAAAPNAAMAALAEPAVGEPAVRPAAKAVRAEHRRLVADAKPRKPGRARVAAQAKVSSKAARKAVTGTAVTVANASLPKSLTPKMAQPKAPLVSMVADAPNDNSVFSRHSREGTTPVVAQVPRKLSGKPVAAKRAAAKPGARVASL